MAFEVLRSEQPDKFFNLDEIRAECKKLNPGELLPGIFWLVNSRGEPVTRAVKLKRSNAGDRIVFAFQNKILYESGKADREMVTGLELTGQNKIDFVEHPFPEMRQLLRDYGAVGFMKAENETREKPARKPLIGAAVEELKGSTEERYRQQVESLVESLDSEYGDNPISETIFTNAINRLSSADDAGPDQRETKLSMKDERGRNIAIDIKYLGNMMVLRKDENDPIVLHPGLMIRMSLPERKGERALEPHAMPDHQARIFSGLVHIMRNPEKYPSVQQEFERLGIKLIELQTREWLEPASREEHQNLRILYERRLLEE